MSDIDTTRRAEQIRERTSMCWENSCRAAELERDAAGRNAVLLAVIRLDLAILPHVESEREVARRCANIGRRAEHLCFILRTAIAADVHAALAQRAETV